MTPIILVRVQTLKPRNNFRKYNMKKLCIYHGNCADGFASAWVVRKKFGEENVEFHPGVYQFPPPDVSERDVIILDFSYKRAVIEEMLKTAHSITIIDHHKSAIEDLEPLKYSLQESFGLLNLMFDLKHSGAMLTWMRYFPDVPVPRLIAHIEDRDLWKFELEGTREIQANVFSYPYDFKIWDNLMEVDVQKLRVEGSAIERKHFKDIQEFIKAAAGRMVIDSYNVPCLNAPYFWSSDAGHIMAQGEPFAACYWETPEGQIFSLRSADNGVDVSAIAKKYGGGGHKHAAGFKLPPGEYLIQEEKP